MNSFVHYINNNNNNNNNNKNNNNNNNNLYLYLYMVSCLACAQAAINQGPVKLTIKKSIGGLF